LKKHSKLEIGLDAGLLNLLFSLAFRWKELRHLTGSELWVELGLEIISAIIFGVFFGLFFTPTFKFLMPYAARIYKNIKS
jgi:hypothetical protein